MLGVPLWSKSNYTGSLADVATLGSPIGSSKHEHGIKYGAYNIIEMKA